MNYKFEIPKAFLTISNLVSFAGTALGILPVHYSLEGAQKRGGEGGSDLPSVSSVEFLCVSKNTSHICRKLSDLLQTAFFDYFFSEKFVKILIDNRGRY